MTKTSEHGLQCTIPFELTKLALYDSKNECTRTDTVFLPISDVCDDTVSLYEMILSPKVKMLTDFFDLYM